MAYLDSSALVKLYLAEPGREEVEKLLESTEAVTTSVIAYTEIRATFARRLRSGELSNMLRWSKTLKATGQGSTNWK